ncbi:MAG TPA: hypothetical protein VGD65_07795 [Chryseosolibacter sp.]
MNRYNFEEEEMTDDELQSVAFTTTSFIVLIVMCVLSWALFT